MIDELARFGLLDPNYWIWIAASLFVLTVLRDMIEGRPCARGH